MRGLIVNADDFGFTEDVNAGIVLAHRQGILTATTLMANGAAFQHAVALAAENPTLDIGCHLVLVGGPSVLQPGRALPTSVGTMMAAVASGRLRVYPELDAQIRRIRAAGIQPTHLDTHKHTHLFPPVLDAVARLSAAHGIAWVRRPFDFPMTGGPASTPWLVRLTSRALSAMRGRFHGVLHRHGCRTTDHFSGFQMTGRFHVKELAAWMEQLPEGITEFMCHPGLCGSQLLAAPTRLKQSRALELEALIAPAVRQAVQTYGIELLRYRDLPLTGKPLCPA
ncbi:MAG: ChbG/HpnK family deacetylase [Acidobacteriia bacterium]|nr:ChbG/HpnK family deacetylase [Terriglobia bacterium]